MQPSQQPQKNVQNIQKPKVNFNYGNQYQMPAQQSYIPQMQMNQISIPQQQDYGYTIPSYGSYPH